MPTINQLIRRPRKSKKKKSKSPLLEQCPQKKGICIDVRTTSPRKPNSAIRKIATVRFSTGIRTIAYIPGEKHTVKTHNVVLVNGKKTRDIGSRYGVIRGTLDAAGVEGRKQAHSRYGAKKKKK